jgi:hypothetical protein
LALDGISLPHNTARLHIALKATKIKLKLEPNPACRHVIKHNRCIPV